ncbi:MAG: hypothetical protein RSC93_01450 [Erysipelotrichaceae bacterium]
MKMKRYCLDALRDFIQRKIVKLGYDKRGNVCFDFTNLITKVAPLGDKTFFRLYIGDGVTMQSAIRDVIQFNKDGNLLTYNVKEIIELLNLDLKHPEPDEHYETWKDERKPIDGLKAVFVPFHTDDSDCLTNWNDTINAYRKRESFKTNQMSIMEFCWYEGYHVYILNEHGEEVEISNESDVTLKHLRHAHNIYRMFHSNAFNLG